jgi:hypothetical protein
MSRPIGREPAKVLLLLCVSVPTFMLNLDANIVAVSLPAIAEGGLCRHRIGGQRLHVAAEFVGATVLFGAFVAIA